MTDNYYNKVYRARIRKLKQLGVEYPARVFWNLSKVGKQYRTIQLKSMLDSIKRLEV